MLNADPAAIGIGYEVPIVKLFAGLLGDLLDCFELSSSPAPVDHRQLAFLIGTEAALHGLT